LVDVGAGLIELLVVDVDVDVDFEFDLAQTPVGILRKSWRSDF
jgi:hypothetical protein